jgi:hypothetical protein
MLARCNGTLSSLLSRDLLLLHLDDYAQERRNLLLPMETRIRTTWQFLSYVEHMSLRIVICALVLSSCSCLNWCSNNLCLTIHVAHNHVFNEQTMNSVSNNRHHHHHYHHHLHHRLNLFHLWFQGFRTVQSYIGPSFRYSLSIYMHCHRCT